MQAIGDNNIPREIKIDSSESPIQRLRPGSAHHAYVLEYLTSRIRSSEDKMKNFYDRWNYSERRHQAYLNLPKYEKMLKHMSDSGAPPQPAVIVFPYQYAVTSTIVTYLTRVFCGRNPIFSLNARNAQSAQNVRNMETMLQYHAEHTNLVRVLFQYLLDGMIYGLSVTRNSWTSEYNYRTARRETTPLERATGATSPTQVSSNLVKTYEGNNVINIDPFMFFPDPNVPMNMVAEKGEYVFWRQFMGKHLLLREEAVGSIRWIRETPNNLPSSSSYNWHNLSNRNYITSGDAHAGGDGRGGQQIPNSIYQIDQGSVDIIPAELGLSDNTRPEKWLFTIANGQQIIQADPLNLDHGHHPVSVTEPYSTGYGFGSPSLSDYVGPIQDIISWFIDSHIYNVRASLNNMFIVDPSKVEMQDVLNPKPGKTIRLKSSAIGTDVRTVMSQLPVSDVTRAHVTDMDAFIRIGDTVSAVSENLRGLQDPGGRKTATEIRVTGESAANRLAALAQYISAQGIKELATQMVLNIQQLQQEEQFLQVSGGEWSSVTPMGLSGDFLYPIQDGTLPIDKVAQQDLWTKILEGVANDPELRQNYSLPRMFEFVCKEIGGAANIINFRIQPELQPPGAIQSGVQSGQLQPINGAVPA